METTKVSVQQNQRDRTVGLRNQAIAYALNIQAPGHDKDIKTVLKDAKAIYDFLKKS